MGLLKNNKVNFSSGKEYRHISRELERINNIILKYNKNIEKCNKKKKKFLDELYYILASYDNFLKKKYETYECKLEGYINEVNKGTNKKYYNSPNNNKIFSYNFNLINDDNLFKRKKYKKKKNKMIALMINKYNHKDKNLHKNEIQDGDDVFSYTKKKWMINNNNNNKKKKKKITNMVSFGGYGNIKRKYVTNKYIINEQENNKLDENHQIDKNKNINIHDFKNEEIREHSTIQILDHSNKKEKIITKNVIKDASRNITKEYDINKYDDNIIEYKEKQREKEKNKSIENMNICGIIYEKRESHNICNILEENKEEEKYKNLQKDIITNCNNNNNNNKEKLEEYHNEKELNNVQIINDKNIKKNNNKKENRKKKKNKNEKQKNNGDILKHLENNVQDLELLYDEKIINVNTKKDDDLGTKNKYSEKDIVHDILSEYSNTLQYTSFLDYMKNRME
ncbi:conserved Plasmodium protein, unknown function [Plasmodium sp. DRC-Itaito]|nr:conserved Plasmodium protein, unknown function [Plasmodium sp. DRC-Itaito]